MQRIYACIDGGLRTDAVIHWAAWAAARLQQPLEFLHVLERHPERADRIDFSGTLGIDAQSSLLQELSAIDERRSRQAQDDGRALLEHARTRAAAAGAERLDGRLRHGELVQTVLEMQADASLIVLGEQRPDDDRDRPHADDRVARLIAAVKCPVLVASDERLDSPRRAVIAIDASAAARRTVELASRSPLLDGLPIRLLMAGTGPAAQRSLAGTVSRLGAAGIRVEQDAAVGEAASLQRESLRALAPALLVLGDPDRARWVPWPRHGFTLASLRHAGLPLLILR